MTVGRLIAFEGGEASGKSTQARLLAADLGAVLTREPGGTPVGCRIRDIVLDPTLDGLDAKAEALLLAADRAQHVAEVIRPALERGDDVVSDRFSGSTLAYQGYGRQLDLAPLEAVSRWAAGDLEPDLVVVLDVAASLAIARVADRGRDRMEAETVVFHQRVADGYRALVAARPQQWVLVDGAGTVDEVAARVRAVVGDRAPRL